MAGQSINQDIYQKIFDFSRPDSIYYITITTAVSSIYINLNVQNQKIKFLKFLLKQ